MEQSVTAPASGLLKATLVLSLFGCVSPATPPSAGPQPAPAVRSEPGGATAAGAPAATAEPPAAAQPVALELDTQAAARQIAEMIGLLEESEGAPLIAAYAEANGVGGAAEILVRLEPELRSKLIRELQRSHPDDVAQYMEALALAAASADRSIEQLREEANQVIDDWHAAAARGDRDGYLGSMAPDARFLGTDSTERWDLAQFTSYVNEHFEPGSGWTFLPDERALRISASGRSAWFDERLASKSYGELRGTGVLERVGEAWKVAHYSMTFTVPNDVAADVVEAVSRSSQ